MARRAPSRSSRLSRRSRRALAALLLLGGSAMSAMTGPASAHDHAIDRRDPPEAMAESLLGQPADPLGSDADWISEDCWSSEDCSAAACTESNSPTLSAAATQHVSAGKADCKPAAMTKNRGGVGMFSGVPGDAADAVADYLRIQQWVAWGADAKQWISPLLTQSPIPADSGKRVNERRFGHELSDLTCEEPIDVQAGTRPRRSRAPLAAKHPVDTVLALAAPLAPARSAPAITPSTPSGVAASEDSAAVQPPAFGHAALIGSAAIIATLDEPYLPYDLSPEDAIAMRMYPIGYPQSSYLGARRTGAYGPVDGLAGGLRWRQVTEPAITLASDAAAARAATPAAPGADQQKQAQRWLASLLSDAIAAVQPDSEARVQLHPQRLASGWGAWVRSTGQSAESAVRSAAVRLAALWQPAPKQRVGAKLVAEAKPQQPPLTAPGASQPDQGADPARLLSVKLACQTAIDVVLAQAARASQPGQSPAAQLMAAADERSGGSGADDSGTGAKGSQATQSQAVASERDGIAAAVDSESPPNPVAAAAQPQPVAPLQQVARAEAVATACDQAALSLEKLAMALRRAGDSLVRQAKAGAGGDGSLLR